MHLATPPRGALLLGPVKWLKLFFPKNIISPWNNIFYVIWRWEQNIKWFYFRFYMCNHVSVLYFVCTSYVTTKTWFRVQNLKRNNIFILDFVYKNMFLLCICFGLKIQQKYDYKIYMKSWLHRIMFCYVFVPT